MLNSTTPPPLKDLGATAEGTLHYVVLADASGSMAREVSNVREAINAQLIDLREQQKAWVSVRVFDHRLLTVHDCVRPADATPVTEEDYAAWGSTALFDAVANTLLDTDTRIAASGGLAPEDKVVIMVFTDGMENASQEFSAEAFKKVLNSFQEREQWLIIMVGSDWETLQAMEGARWKKEHLVRTVRGEEKESLRASYKMAKEIFERKRARFDADEL